ncbi:alpha/beta hydrolase [Rhodophyticola sp. CCM32]|uniref:alpha/beta hydrolase n=1 Tax=Rhodophyticola sp. CCM32 TaxID=2916397 RepID=UPI00107EF70F|nr:alpha/beta hydrolase [Rhodophyticola sp. CCM32]QBY02392.1 alpha/beta hydrolase [Rhodophyticola sp. CCM32]
MDYIISTRSVNSGKFTNNPGVTRYLKIIPGAAGQKVAHFLTADAWAAEVLAQANGQGVLIHVHGFNIQQRELMARHDLVRDGLKAQGFGGAVVSFDWPTNGVFLEYAKDRADAHTIAPQLVLDVIGVLRKAKADVKIDIFAHSMGNLVTRHAFTRLVELGKATALDFSVGEVLMVAADIAGKSMNAGAKKSKALYDFSGRITNYYSRADEILSLSQIYRLGQASRLGFSGLPDRAPADCANVTVQNYYIQHKNEWPQSTSISHNWEFLDATFYRDAALTLAGTPANAMPTRGVTDLGNQALIG